MRWGRERDDAFERLFADERRAMVGSLTLWCGDRDLAEDAVAEAFARAHVRWRRVSTMDSPAGWVYRVALNHLRSLLPDRSGEPGPPATTAPGQGASAPDPTDGLWDAVRALPERERTAVVLRYVADLRQREVAEVMGIAPGTVAATLSSARSKLRLDLEEATDA